MTLQEVLLDDGRPFCSHYGAVVGLTELGPEVRDGGWEKNRRGTLNERGCFGERTRY